MKQFLFLIAVFYSLFMTSQDVFVEKITLEWLPNQLIQIDKDQAWNMPIVKGNSVNIESKIPEFTKKWEVPNKTKIKDFELNNIKTAVISKADLLDVKLENITANMEANLQIVSTRDKSHAYINVAPLISENGRIKKIVSFEVQYKLKYNVVSKRTYASSSVLASGQWYKFSVDTTGVHKIDKDFLDNLGISTNSINPQNLAIYGNGGKLLPYKVGDFRHDDLQENSIYVEGETDGSFDNNDYILFYAQGPESWKHENTAASLEHQKNIYTDKAYYFIHVKSQPGKRIVNDVSSVTNPQTNFTNYDDFIVHEIDKKNLFQMGQQWFGEAFDINNEQTISMNFANLDTSFPVTVKTSAIAASIDSSTMDVSIGNQGLYTLSFFQTSRYQWATSNELSTSINLSSEDIDIKLSYNNNGQASARSYLDFIEIIGKKKLIVGNKQFGFRNFEAVNTANAISYSLQNASNIYNLWDVTDPINPVRIENISSGNDFIFNANGGVLKEYVVVNQQDYYTPQTIDEPIVQNQNLHGLENIDYVIITKDFC